MTKLFEHDLDVVGLKFRMKRELRQQFATHISTGMASAKAVTLSREQENKYDINAIRVDLVNKPGFLEKKHIGYIRADSAAILAPLMDEGLVRGSGGLVFKSAKLLGIVGDDLTEGRLHVTFTDRRKG